MNQISAHVYYYLLTRGSLADALLVAAASAPTDTTVLETAAREDRRTDTVPAPTSRPAR